MKLLKKALSYQTKKYLVVDDVWQIGLLYRVLQAGVLAWALYEALSEHTWAHTETPAGSVNGWHETTDAYNNASTGARPAYCGSQDYEFRYTNTWIYHTPECIILDDREIAQKGRNSLFITTTFIEEQVRGFPCATVANRSEPTTECPNGVDLLASGQCQCSSSRTVVPVGVEHLDVVFEHSYFTSSKIGLSGSSNRVDPGAKPLKTFFTKKDGTVLSFEPPTSPRMRLTDLLDLIDDFTLDEPNRNVTTDVGQPLKYPRRRTTGAQLELKLTYSNRVRRADRVGSVQAENKEVHADLVVEAASGGWAGWGSHSFQIVPQTGSYGNETYHKVMRYRQGIVLNFIVTGTVYWLDPYVLLSLLIASVVLLGAARTVTDLVVFSIPGWLTSGVTEMLSGRRYEHASKKGVFAELGIKAAIYAQQFSAMDHDSTGTLKFEDVVRIFGHVQDVDYDLAVRITQRIFDDVGVEKDGGEKTIDFREFMTLVEGQMMDFDHYLKYAERGGKVSVAGGALAAARQMYADVEGKMLQKKKPSHGGSTSTETVTPAVASGPPRGGVSMLPQSGPEKLSTV